MPRCKQQQKRTRLGKQGSASWWRKFALSPLVMFWILFRRIFPPNFWILSFESTCPFFPCLHRGIIRALLTRSTIGGNLLFTKSWQLMYFCLLTLCKKNLSNYSVDLIFIERISQMHLYWMDTIFHVNVVRKNANVVNGFTGFFRCGLPWTLILVSAQGRIEAGGAAPKKPVNPSNTFAFFLTTLT